MTEPTEQPAPGDRLNLEVKIRQEHPGTPPAIQVIFSRPGMTQTVEFPYTDALRVAEGTSGAIRQAYEVARRMALGLDVVQQHNGRVPPLSQLLDPRRGQDG